MTDPDFRGVPAGIVTRSLACALDACVVVATMLVLWGGWSVVSFLSTPVRFDLPRPTWTHVVLTAAVTAVLYLATSWALSGRTYGDQVLGIRVLRHGLRPLGWWRSLIRSVTCVLFPLGLVWTALDRRNRSLQDLFCASTVVYDWVPRAKVGTARSPRAGTVA